MDAATEAYLAPRYWVEDKVLASLRQDIQTHTTPIAVSPEAGKLLTLLVMSSGARRILEVGTLFGYSAICMARALPPGGHLDTVELSSFHADSAERWFKEAGVAERIHIHRGSSAEVLPNLKGPYDLVFLDADKTKYVSDAKEALRLLRPGGLLLADNMIWSGRVGDEKISDESTVGVRSYHDFISRHPDLTSTVLPVGDGMSLSVKRG